MTVSKIIYEVKLVPVDEPNADGRWTSVEATKLKRGQVIGSEFVVQYRPEQPFYMHGGPSIPEFRLE